LSYPLTISIKSNKQQTIEPVQPLPALQCIPTTFLGFYARKVAHSKIVSINCLNSQAL